MTNSIHPANPVPANPVPDTDRRLGGDSPRGAKRRREGTPNEGPISVDKPDTLWPREQCPVAPQQAAAAATTGLGALTAAALQEQHRVPPVQQPTQQPLGLMHPPNPNTWVPALQQQHQVPAWPPQPTQPPMGPMPMQQAAMGIERKALEEIYSILANTGYFPMLRLPSVAGHSQAIDYHPEYFMQFGVGLDNSYKNYIDKRVMVQNIIRQLMSGNAAILPQVAQYHCDRATQAEQSPSYGIDINREEAKELLKNIGSYPSPEMLSAATSLIVLFREKKEAIINSDYHSIRVHRLKDGFYKDAAKLIINEMHPDPALRNEPCKAVDHIFSEVEKMKAHSPYDEKYRDNWVDLNLCNTLPQEWQREAVWNVIPSQYMGAEEKKLAAYRAITGEADPTYSRLQAMNHLLKVFSIGRP